MNTNPLETIAASLKEFFLFPLPISSKLSPILSQTLRMANYPGNIRQFKAGVDRRDYSITSIIFHISKIVAEKLVKAQAQAKHSFNIVPTTSILTTFIVRGGIIVAPSDGILSMTKMIMLDTFFVNNTPEDQAAIKQDKIEAAVQVLIEEGIIKIEPSRSPVAYITKKIDHLLK